MTSPFSEQLVSDLYDASRVQEKSGPPEKEGRLVELV